MRGELRFIEESKEKEGREDEVVPPSSTTQQSFPKEKLCEPALTEQSSLLHTSELLYEISSGIRPGTLASVVWLSRASFEDRFVLRSFPPLLS